MSNLKDIIEDLETLNCTYAASNLRRIVTSQMVTEGGGVAEYTQLLMKLAENRGVDYALRRMQENRIVVLNDGTPIMKMADDPQLMEYMKKQFDKAGLKPKGQIDRMQQTRMFDPAKAELGREKLYNAGALDPNGPVAKGLSRLDPASAKQKVSPANSVTQSPKGNSRNVNVDDKGARWAQAIQRQLSGVNAQIQAIANSASSTADEDQMGGFVNAYEQNANEFFKQLDIINPELSNVAKATNDAKAIEKAVVPIMQTIAAFRECRKATLDPKIGGITKWFSAGRMGEQLEVIEQKFRTIEQNLLRLGGVANASPDAGAFKLPAQAAEQPKVAPPTEKQPAVQDKSVAPPTTVPKTQNSPFV